MPPPPVLEDPIARLIDLSQTPCRTIIALVGYPGSGKSTAAHLHYEVVRNGKKVNPVDFFYNDLTPEQYAKVIEMASKGNQPFD